MSLITVKVKPNAKTEKIEQVDATNFIVSVHATPSDGQANAAVIRALADFFDVAPSLIRIKRGQTSRQKIVEIAD